MRRRTRGRWRRRSSRPASLRKGRFAKVLLGFGDAVDASIELYAPHKLCGYLFEVASTFTDFYEHCPVLRAPDESFHVSRLGLCSFSAQVLEKGLGLLGIDAPERM